MHWHKLIVSFEEQIVYFHEPFGGALESWDFGKHIQAAFDGTLGLIRGWRLQSIEVKLQTDGCNWLSYHRTRDLPFWSLRPGLRSHLV